MNQKNFFLYATNLTLNDILRLMAIFTKKLFNLENGNFYIFSFKIKKIFFCTYSFTLALFLFQILVVRKLNNFCRREESGRNKIRLIRNESKQTS